MHFQLLDRCQSAVYPGRDHIGHASDLFEYLTGLGSEYIWTSATQIARYSDDQYSHVYKSTAPDNMTQAHPQTIECNVISSAPIGDKTAQDDLSGTDECPI